jgi:hypothetical protein
MYPIKTAPSIFIHQPKKPACMDCKHVNKTGVFSCNLLSQKLEFAHIPTALARIEPFQSQSLYCKLLNETY